MSLENLWYLAHPVAPTERWTLRQNLAHAEKVGRIAWDAGFRVVMPWYSHLHFLDEANEEHRAEGLKCDLHLVRLIRKVIYTGDRFSAGMQLEADTAIKVNAVELDAVGLPDRELPAFFKQKATRHL